MIRYGSPLIISMIFSIGTASADANEQRIEAATKGCTPYLTVQSRQCQVQQTFECGTDGFVQVLYDQNIATSIEYSGPNGGPGDFFSLDKLGGIRVHNGTPGFSIEQLRMTGASTEDVTLDMLLSGFEGHGIEASLKASLSIETEVISGISFRKGMVAMAISMPAEIGTMTSLMDIRVADDIGFILTGQTTTMLGENSTIEASHIMQVYRPGDDGFMVNHGLYDCGELG